MSSTTIATISSGFRDDDFRLALETVLASCHRDAADVDEVLATVRRIAEADSDSWLREWTTTAGSVWRAGVAAEREGYGVTALAHHRRAATYYAAALRRVLHSTAAVLDPGVLDFSSAWTDLLPGPMRTQLESRAREGFDRAMLLAELFSPALSGALRALAQPHGPETQSRYELFRTIARYRLGDEVARITTPLLITDPVCERFWPGQSRQLHDRLPGPKALIRLTSEHADASHDEPPAAARRETGTLEWLARQVSHVGQPPRRSATPAAISDPSTHAADREAR
ncbi:MAG: hypothetical protein ACLP50_31945 [Solirubrobacteraceae bacterium]